MGEMEASGREGEPMVNRTKLAIVDAFNTLIQTRDFDRITVQAIAEEAEVSKATFYRYFKDKYDVMNYNYKRILDDALATRDIVNYHDLYYRLYCLGETQLRAIKGAFRSTGVNSFERYIYEYSKMTVEEITRLNRDGEGLSPDEVLQLDVFCFGISFMYKQWIAGKYDVDAATAADRLYEMMPETLKGYWFPQA